MKRTARRPKTPRAEGQTNNDLDNKRDPQKSHRCNEMQCAAPGRCEDVLPKEAAWPAAGENQTKRPRSVQTWQRGKQMGYEVGKGEGAVGGAGSLANDQA